MGLLTTSARSTASNLTLGDSGDLALLSIICGFSESAPSLCDADHKIEHLPNFHVDSNEEWDVDGMLQ
jgi:hypothetical protein